MCLDDKISNLEKVVIEVKLVIEIIDVILLGCFVEIGCYYLLMVVVE